MGLQLLKPLGSATRIPAVIFHMTGNIIRIDGDRPHHRIPPRSPFQAKVECVVNSGLARAVIHHLCCADLSAVKIIRGEVPGI